MDLIWNKCGHATLRGSLHFESILSCLVKKIKQWQCSAHSESLKKVKEIKFFFHSTLILPWKSRTSEDRKLYQKSRTLKILEQITYNRTWLNFIQKSKQIDLFWFLLLPQFERRRDSLAFFSLFELRKIKNQNKQIWYVLNFSQRQQKKHYYEKKSNS